MRMVVTSYTYASKEGPGLKRTLAAHSARALDSAVFDLIGTHGPPSLRQPCRRIAATVSHKLSLIFPCWKRTHPKRILYIRSLREVKGGIQMHASTETNKKTANRENK
jgi:hypothetical protein